MKRLLGIFLLTAASLAFSQQVQLTSRVDRTTYRLGDWIDVHVDGTLPSGIDTIAPAVKDSIGVFELVSSTRDGVNPKWTLRVTSTDSGSVTLPPIPFSYKLKGDTTTRYASTNPLPITLTGVIVDRKGDIKEIKSPLWAPWLFEDFLPYLIALLVLAAAGVGYYFYRKYRKNKAAAAVEIKVSIPPHKEALSALHALEEQKLWQKGLVKEYYTGTTDIIRRFFEKRWNVVALEMTSDDILAQMKHIPEALKIWNDMESFFRTADLAKFAKFEPTPSDHEREMQTAYRIVQTMVPKITAEPRLPDKQEERHAG